MLNFINGIIILVVVFWIAGVLSRTLESYLRRSSAFSYNARELVVKFFRIFVYFCAFLITLSAMGVDLTAFAVFGGALGVGIGLGLQKVTANFVSGITLLLEKSIKLGDLIEVAGNTGWVRALNIRYALMETSDGREILIPNEELTSTRVTNWTHSNEQARVEIKATLDFATDAKKAISEYQKAIGLPDGMLELRLYFCEVAMDFSMEYGYAEDGFFNAVYLQFKKVVEALGKISGDQKDDTLDRLYDLRNVASNVGYGLEDDMGDLLAEANPDDVRN